MIFRTAFAALVLTATAFAADSALLSLLPSDAKAVAGVNVDRTANSPFGQLLLSQMQDKDENFFAKIEEKTGFDPRRDLREILIVTTTMTPARGKHNGLVLGRGTFDIPRVLETARNEGAAITNYKDASVMTSIGNSNEGWVALLSGGIALMGSPAEVRGAIDRRGQASALDAKLQGKVQEVSGRYDAWMVTTSPAGALPARLPSKEMNRAVNPRMLEAIEQASGGVRFGADIEVNGEAITRTDKDATALADVLRFLASMLQMNRERPEASQLASFLDALEVNATANVMTIKLVIPQHRIEEFIKSSRSKAVRRAAR